MVQHRKSGAKGPVSEAFISLGIENFASAFEYIHQLPYARNTDPAGLLVVLDEHKGTCSTKHALLKRYADEQEMQGIQLILGIYKMNGNNTPGVGMVLQKHKLSDLLEAHCYLKINGKIADATSTLTASQPFENDLLEEFEILPEQIGPFKAELHRRFLQDWLQQQSFDSVSESEIWNIREQCIGALQLANSVQTTDKLDGLQMAQVNAMWNEEYPVALKDRFPLLLEGGKWYKHFYISNEKNEIKAWALVFEKEEEIRFSIIVSGVYQGQGLGSILLERLKLDCPEFYGWVIDHNEDKKSNGNPYVSPLQFYIKQGMKVLPEVRVDNDILRAVKIKWKRNETKLFHHK